MTEAEETGKAIGRCPTGCDPDCDADCHETHDVPAKRGHRPEDCPSRSGRREAMSEERLAEIRHDSRNDRWEFSYDAGDAVRDLLAEVERLRGVEAQRDAYWATLERYDGQAWDGLLAERDAAVERAETAERELAEMRELDGDWEPGRWRRVRRPDGSLWMETSDHDEAQAEAEKTGWPLERLYVNTRSEWRVVGDGEVADGG